MTPLYAAAIRYADAVRAEAVPVQAYLRNVSVTLEQFKSERRDEVEEDGWRLYVRADAVASLVAELAEAREAAIGVLDAITNFARPPEMRDRVEDGRRMQAAVARVRALAPPTQPGEPL